MFPAYADVPLYPLVFPIFWGAFALFLVIIARRLRKDIHDLYGYNAVVHVLTASGIGFVAADNAFVRIDDWPRAQALADQLSPDRLHRVLDRYARQCCPVLDAFDYAVAHGESGATALRDQLAGALAKEVERDGVAVHVVITGPVATPMLDDRP